MYLPIYDEETKLLSHSQLTVLLVCGMGVTFAGCGVWQNDYVVPLGHLRAQNPLLGETSPFGNDVRLLSPLKSWKMGDILNATCEP